MRWRGAALQASFVVAWSSGFVGARMGTDVAATSTLLAWRFAILALIGAPLLRSVPAGERGHQTAVGLLSVVGYLLAITGAIELGVPAALAALVAALQPAVTAALVGPVLGATVPLRRWLGLAIGLAGTALALGADLRLGGAPSWAYLLPLVAVASLVAATLLEARRPSTSPPAAVLAWHGLVAAVAITALAALQGGLRPDPSPTFWVAVGWLIVLSTLGGYGLYWATLRATEPVRVATLIYLTAPVTALWAWLQFGDPLRPVVIAGLLITLLGVRLARPGAAGSAAATRATGATDGRPTTTGCGAAGSARARGRKGAGAPRR